MGMSLCAIDEVVQVPDAVERCGDVGLFWGVFEGWGMAPDVFVFGGSGFCFGVSF